jgi:hypothetical protein
MSPGFSWLIADCPAHAEAALGEVQTVAGATSDAVGRDPHDLRRVEAAGEDEVLDETADLVVHQRGDDGAAQAEDPSQAADDVVLAAAFPCLERSGGTDATLARVEAKHDLAERDGVVRALGRWTQLHGRPHFPIAAAAATAPAHSSLTWANAPSRIASTGTIQEPPTAGTHPSER